MKNVPDHHSSEIVRASIKIRYFRPTEQAAQDTPILLNEMLLRTNRRTSNVYCIL